MASIDEQTFDDFEWIVVDGNSSDGSAEFVASIRRSAFQGISEPDAGIYDAMNKGIARASGQFVVFLNAGDAFADEDTLATVYGAARSGLTPDLIYGGANLLMQNGRRAYRAPRDVSYIWHGLPGYHQATYYRRSCISSRGYDLSYRICGDYYLTARLVMDQAHSKVIEYPLVNFRMGDLSFRHPFRLVGECWRVQREVVRLHNVRRVQSAFKRIVNMAAVRVLNSSILRLRSAEKL